MAQKLYTEEQVRQAIQMADKYHYLNESEDDSIINTLTPIEIPSDEEIERELESYEHTTLELEAGFRAGAKWMQYKILNQNK